MRDTLQSRAVGDDRGGTAVVLNFLSSESSRALQLIPGEHVWMIYLMCEKLTPGKHVGAHVALTRYFYRPSPKIIA